jgi:hypothetical protein
MAVEVPLPGARAWDCLGVYPDVLLKVARERCGAARQMVADEVDTSEQ